MAERNLKVVAEFQRRRKAQMMLVAPLILMFIGMAWLEDQPNGTLLGLPKNAVLGAGVALIMAVVVFSFRNWRCPGCGRYLGKTISPKFCQHCGVPLQ